ncbi:cytotoxic T-lymphocyte protein 4 [Solea solea]|uniref:cytotoxic T-lymphocyte protein 4 n=1 Tax=Solea solea TaxID=90069 RepID=UPI00272BBD41|nr:cytotoxic T-lymphocyte protein 4 [Solea solea]
MFPTHCVRGWMLMTVLGLLLPPVWSAVKVIQPYRAVGINGTAQVQCFIHPQPSNHIQASDVYPYPDPEEVRVALLVGLHGNRELCSSVVNLTKHGGTGEKKDREVQCSVQVIEGAMEVTVSGLKATDTELYRCQIEVLYPPPYLRLTGNGTLVHVLGDSDCPMQELQRALAHRRDEGEEGEGGEMNASLSAPVVVLVTLVMFVLIIIIYFQTIQCRQGRRETVQTISGGHC